MKLATTKFAFASIHILFTVLLISGVSVKDAECQDGPCAELAAQAKCPCNYNMVPKTEACWGQCKTCTGNAVFQPCITSNCDSANDFCALYRINLINGSVNDLSVYSKPLGGTDHWIQTCKVRFESTKDCPAKANYSHQLTTEQAETCFCLLKHYADDLSVAGIDITGGSPPFDCQP